MSLANSPFWMSSVGGDFYDHTIDTALRFNDDDSPYLQRSVSHNRQTYYISFWEKRGNIER